MNTPADLARIPRRGRAVSRGFRFESFADAGRGLRALLAEPNARVQLASRSRSSRSAPGSGSAARDWALLVLAIGLVLACEAANTALEALADRVAPERHPLVGEGEGRRGRRAC